VRAIRLMFGLVFIGFLPYAVAVGVLRRLTRDWNPYAGWLVADLIPVIAALAGFIAYEALSRGGSVLDALTRIGLRPPSWRAAAAGFLGGLPAWLVLVWVMLRPGADASPGPYVVLTIVRVLLAQALLEEIVFRGIAFRRAAETMSFARATVVSAIAFGISHIGNLVGRGTSEQALAEVGIQVFLTSILALAPIRLFKSSGGVLWGACIWHLMIDTSIFFPKLTPDSSSALLLVFGSLATLPTSALAARWLGGNLKARVAVPPVPKA